MTDAYYETVARSLEQLHKDRNLKFSSVFDGYVPVQAFGFVDNVRFYFREREGNVSLTVGRYNPFAEINSSFGMTKEVVPNERVIKVTTHPKGDLIQVFTRLLKQVPVQKDDKFSEIAMEMASRNYENQVQLVEALQALLTDSDDTIPMVADRLGLTEEELEHYTSYLTDLTFTELRLLATSLGVEISYTIKKR